MNDIPVKSAARKDNYVCSNCRTTIPLTTPDYYWRDYTGKIPDDAIPGGHDINNAITYIGQAFYKGIGILTGTIYPGKTGIKVPCSGCNTCDVGIKILCSRNSNNFAWQDADSSNLHLTTIGKHLVIGGCEDGKMINVGRASYQGEVIVGKVLGFVPEKAKLCFIHNDKEITVNSYQVLVYKGN